MKTSEGKLQRIPPQSTDAEEAILGAVLTNPVCFNKIADMLTAKSFYKPAHRFIYEAVVDLFTKNQAIDIVTVSEVLNEKDKLEAMVKDDPKYFYKILPYTYVLNVSDKWIKKFESITIEPPTWYGSNDAFDYIYFSSFVSRTMTSATSAMTSMPSSSSSIKSNFSKSSSDM